MGELEGAELGGAGGEEEKLVWGFTYGGGVLWLSLLVQSPPRDFATRNPAPPRNIFGADL